jgi:hypothetical protein
MPAMQPAVEAFWDAYAGQQPPPTTGGTRLLRRALEFAGGRLVLAALEEAQTLDELRPSVLSTLQLGANVLRRPDEAAVHLLGIRTYRERF